MDSAPPTSGFGLKPARPVLAALLGACLMLPACVWDLAKFKEPKSVTAPSVANSALEIQTRNGAVSVTRSSVSQVEITAEVRAQTEERAKAAQVRAVRNDKGVLVIDVVWPDGAPLACEGAQIHVKTPDAHGVTINTDNGSITLAGCTGAAALTTRNGRITVNDHDGPLMAHTSNGEISLDFVEGAIDAQSSNGRVTITDAAGPVQAVTSNGRIRVVLTADNAGPADLKTSNGAVTLLVGPAFAGSLSARTSNGSITIADMIAKAAKSVDIHKRTAGVEFATPGKESTIKTSNGSIEVDAAPTDTRGNKPGFTSPPAAPAVKPVPAV